MGRVEAAHGIPLAFEFCQIAPRLGNDCLRNAGERRDLQSIALICRSFFDAVKEYQPVAMFDSFDVHVGHTRRFAGAAVRTFACPSWPSGPLATTSPRR